MLKNTISENHFWNYVSIILEIRFQKVKISNSKNPFFGMLKKILF